MGVCATAAACVRRSARPISKPPWTPSWKGGRSRSPSRKRSGARSSGSDDGRGPTRPGGEWRGDFAEESRPRVRLNEDGRPGRGGAVAARGTGGELVKPPKRHGGE